jgi:hypothetical protein
MFGTALHHTGQYSNKKNGLSSRSIAVILGIMPSARGEDPRINSRSHVCFIVLHSDGWSGILVCPGNVLCQSRNRFVLKRVVVIESQVGDLLLSHEIAQRIL